MVEEDNVPESLMLFMLPTVVFSTDGKRLHTPRLVILSTL